MNFEHRTAGLSLALTLLLVITSSCSRTVDTGHTSAAAVRPSASTSPTPTLPSPVAPTAGKGPDVSEYLADTGYERLTEEHNFGSVQQGSEVLHTFTIENNATKVLRLGVAQTTTPCCLSAELTSENLAPGETASVTIRLDTTHRPGSFFANIAIPILSEPVPKAYLYRILGDVSETIVVEPGVVVVDKQGRGSFDVRSARFKTGLKIVNVQSDNDSVKVVPGPVKGERQTFSITSGAGKDFFATIRVVTNDSEIPDMLVACQSNPLSPGH